MFTARETSRIKLLLLGLPLLTALLACAGCGGRAAQTQAGPLSSDCLWLLQVKDPELAQAMRAEIKDGRSFVIVGRKVSRDHPQAASQDLGCPPLAGLPYGVVEAANRLELGQVGVPMEIGGATIWVMRGSDRHRLLSQALFERKRYQAAADEALADLTLNPASIGSWLVLGQSRLALKDPAGAFKAVEQALLVDPRDPDLLKTRALALEQIMATEPAGRESATAASPAPPPAPEPETAVPAPEPALTTSPRAAEPAPAPPPAPEAKPEAAAPAPEPTVATSPRAPEAKPEVAVPAPEPTVATSPRAAEPLLAAPPEPAATPDQPPDKADAAPRPPSPAGPTPAEPPAALEPELTAAQAELLRDILAKARHEEESGDRLAATLSFHRAARLSPKNEEATAGLRRNFLALDAPSLERMQAATAAATAAAVAAEPAPPAETSPRRMAAASPTPSPAPAAQSARGPAEPPTRTAAPGAETGQAGGVYIQVASYRDREGAEREQRIWRERQFKAVISPWKAADGVTWQRVLVGPYPNTDKARESARRMKKDQALDFYLLVNAPAR